MDTSRAKQVAAAAGVILGVAGLYWLLVWATTWPGFAGEFARVLAGIFTTPALLEPAFLFCGLVIVLLLNCWRRHREGPEWVCLEQVAEPNELPEHARFAVYANPPLAPEAPDPLTRAEGALAIGDCDAAAEALAALTPAELESPAALGLRLNLARTTGRTLLADDLARRLQQQASTCQSTVSSTREPTRSTNQPESNSEDRKSLRTTPAL
jgi:hypothetical protein